MKRLTLRALCSYGFGVAALLLMVLTTAATAGCDSTATFLTEKVRVDRVQLLSTVPIVEEGGEERPSCQVGPDDKVTGFEIAFNLKSTSPKWCCSGPFETSSCDEGDPAKDRDTGIRPGDPIAGGQGDAERRFVDRFDANLTTGSFAFDVTCVEPLPGTPGQTCPVASPTLSVSQLQWTSNYDAAIDDEAILARCEPAAVALLIDRSGSMLGLVDSERGYREDVQDRISIPSDEERKLAATDLQETRLVAARTFISNLNSNDKLVVFTYQERRGVENLQVVCTQPPLEATGDLAGAPEYFRKALNCFGVNRDVVKSEFLEPSFVGLEANRTPLWEAVEAAYDFLNDPKARAPRNRHIVVIGDGPDTCSDEGEEFIRDLERTPCSDADYDSLRDYVEQKNQEPGAPQVHIHFVQLQAEGYMERDARQQEMACLTGGHYMFVNSREFPSDIRTSELKAGIDEALDRIRASIAGHWTLRAATAAFTAGAGTTGYLAPGSLFGISGRLTLSPGDFTRSNKLAEFDASGTDQTGRWDQRLSFRRMCEDDAQCLAPGQTASPCKMYCSAQQAVCLDEPVNLPDQTACDLGGGTFGVCCQGDCQATCN